MRDQPDKPTRREFWAFGEPEIVGAGQLFVLLVGSILISNVVAGTLFSDSDVVVSLAPTLIGIALACIVHDRGMLRGWLSAARSWMPRWQVVLPILIAYCAGYFVFRDDSRSFHPESIFHGRHFPSSGLRDAYVPLGYAEAKLRGITVVLTSPSPSKSRCFNY